MAWRQDRSRGLTAAEEQSTTILRTALGTAIDYSAGEVGLTVRGVEGYNVQTLPKYFECRS